MTNYENGFISRCLSVGMDRGSAIGLLSKKAQFIDSLTDKVNFLANVKVLSDASNGMILNKMDGDKVSSSPSSNDGEREKNNRISVMFSGDLGRSLSEEQKKMLVAVAKRISDRRRKSGGKK